MNIVISGWNPGLKVISLIDFLRKHGGMSLVEAKLSVDKLLQGTAIKFAVISDDDFHEISESLKKIGTTSPLQSDARNEYPPI